MINLDLVYREIGYSNLFKNICRLKEGKSIRTSGYQLNFYKKQLDRFGINYQALDIGYGFVIKLKEEI